MLGLAAWRLTGFACFTSPGASTPGSKSGSPSGPFAQELHDTLLQGFVGASLQLHPAADIPPEPSPARAPLACVAEELRGDRGRPQRRPWTTFR